MQAAKRPSMANTSPFSRAKRIVRPVTVQAPAQSPPGYWLSASSRARWAVLRARVAVAVPNSLGRLGQIDVVGVAHGLAHPVGDRAGRNGEPDVVQGLEDLRRDVMRPVLVAHHRHARRHGRTRSSGPGRPSPRERHPCVPARACTRWRAARARSACRSPGCRLRGSCGARRARRRQGPRRRSRPA